MKISKVDDATLQMIQQYQKTEKVEDRASEKPGAANNLVPEEKVNHFHHGKGRTEPEERHLDASRCPGG